MDEQPDKHTKAAEQASADSEQNVESRSAESAQAEQAPAEPTQPEQAPAEPAQSEQAQAEPAEPEQPAPKRKPNNPGVWGIDLNQISRNDPLLRSLVILSKIYDNPISQQALTSGLPLDDGKLTPELFIRAASRANIAADINQYLIADISEKMCPAVLLLEDRKACILMGFDEDGKAEVIYPETGHGCRHVDVDELLESYTGYAILTSPQFEYSERSKSLCPEPDDHWFWGVVKKAWPIYSEVLLASLLVNLFAISMPLFIMNVYDRVVPNKAIETLWALAIGIFIVFAFDFILKNIRSYFIDVAGKNIDVELSANMFAQLVGMKLSTRPKSVGVLSNTVQSFDSFREFITSATINVLVDLPFVFLFIGVIWFIGGSLALVPLAAIPIILIASLLLQAPLNRLVQESFRHASEKQAAMYEALSHVESIKTSNAESPMQRKWEKLVCHSAKLSTKLRLLSNTTITFAAFVQQLTTVCLVIYGVFLISEGLLTTGGLIASTILVGRALAPMSQVAGLFTRYHQAMASLKALHGIMNQPAERDKAKSTLHRQRFAGDITFKNVFFKYPDTEVETLHDVSFKIQAGERVGIIGRIGSGKTTLEKLIVGLYSPESGSILVDGVEINQIDTADLRHNIGYVPQDIELFYGSVKDNMVLGAPYTDDEQIIRAAEISGVSQFVNTHPQGFDRDVGERGANLSGGQRQAISVARSLILDPPILVMDEPTNFMDDKTESILKNRLTPYVQDKTFLLITHRGTMLTLVDRLIVLDRGRVVADGPKDFVLNALSEGRIKANV